MKENPFKMIGPWIGAISTFIYSWTHTSQLGLSTGFFTVYWRQLPKFGCKGDIISSCSSELFQGWIIIPLIGFLIGWAIQHFMSKRRR